MPWFILIGISALIGIAGIAYGCDQENKREEEQKRAHAEIAKLKYRISALEQEHDRLLPVLGKKDHQVRTLVDEIAKLRSELEEARRRAGTSAQRF